MNVYAKRGNSLPVLAFDYIRWHLEGIVVS